MTGEDLNYKQSTVEQAKFVYSPLSKFKKKRIKEQVERQLGEIKNIKTDSKSSKMIVFLVD